MPDTYRMLQQEDLRGHDNSREFCIDVMHGLSGRPRSLPSKYFYDEVGSRLFAKICDLDEYYPTRCEAEVLSSHTNSIGAHLGATHVRVVDLGAGDGRKTRILLDGLSQRSVPWSYCPIDISETAIADLTERARGWGPGRVEGIVGEYFDSLRWLSQNSGERNLVLFLGSNIGNFDYKSARRFLRQLWDALNPDDFVLIGFDLKKDIELLLSAYNDEAGVTAAFNLNLLTRINRELGGSFDLSKWRHYSTYDVYAGAMHSYLVSMESQRVHIDALSQEFEFAAWEPIQTEYSYKYLDSDISALAADTGFVPVEQFYDERAWFTDCLWQVSKNPEIRR